MVYDFMMSALPWVLIALGTAVACAYISRSANLELVSSTRHFT